MDTILETEVKRILMLLAASTGVSGDEQSAADTAIEIMKPLGKCERGALGTVICRVRDGGENAAHLMLCAHIDQIGLIVTRVDEKGFLRVSNVGGIDRATLWAANVTVHAEGGDLPGVVCTLPPHVAGDGDKKNLKPEQAAIDIGLDEKGASALVRPGDRVTLVSPPVVMPNEIICGGVTDDRAGCAAVIAAAALAAPRISRGSLSVLLSTQEETGGAGAKTGANQLRPTRAIAVDVSFAHTPDAPREKCGIMGKGPMIGAAPILDRHMTRRLRQLAQERDIPCQQEVMGGVTGTDADSIATSGSGVATALVSIPQKFMHTPNEMVAVADVANCAKLIGEYAVEYLEGGGDNE